MAEQAVKFEAAKPRRAFDDIIDQVRGLLLSGQLKPGEKLPSERDFALQLGVSRNTVREALRMLEIAGLVTLKKGHTGGAFLAASTAGAVTRGFQDGLSLTEFSLWDLTEARLGVETVIVKLACERGTEADFEDLEAVVESAAQISARVDWPGKVAAHMEFHVRLAAAARNPVLELLIRPLNNLTTDLVLRIGPSADDVIGESRHRLLAALRNRDAEAAVAELSSYMTDLYERWVRRAS